jgi:hypothetical protein
MATSAPRWLARCHSAHRWQADRYHIIERRKGGPDVIGNLRTLCTPATPTATATVVVAAQPREGDAGFDSLQGGEHRPAHRKMGIFAKFQNLFFT